MVLIQNKRKIENQFYWKPIHYTNLPCLSTHMDNKCAYPMHMCSLISVFIDVSLEGMRHLAAVPVTGICCSTVLLETCLVANPEYRFYCDWPQLIRLREKESLHCY